MRTSRNYYEILGLSRGATPAQIKKRYKELVRKYHPDVAKDKNTAHRLFIQINEAYQTLGDPGSRRAYDQTLDSAEAARRAASRPQAAQPQAAPGQVSSAKGPTQLIKDAQFAFIQRRLGEAANLCKEALKLDPRNAKAYATLGDIYRAQGKTGNAIKYYSYAMQYNPRDMDSQTKLMDLVGKQVTREQSSVTVENPKRAAAYGSIWWGIVLLCILLIGIYPGEPIPWMRIYIPVVDKWSWNLIVFMAVASAIAGGLLASRGMLRHPDEELIFENANNWAVVPTGIILLIGSGFFFAGAAIFYIVVGLLQASLSRSVLTVFGTVVMIVLLSAMMYMPQARHQVVMFGGNVAFLSSLFGWYIGSSMRPLGDG